MVTIPIKQLPHAEGLDLPFYATEDAAGLDLTAAIDEPYVLAAGESAMIKTGLSIALPKGYEAQIRPRSGLAYKSAVTVLNTPGTIDADYRGEIGIILINHGKKDFVIERGMRIAQMVIAPYTRAQFNAVENLEETSRGAGGFGSTGSGIVAAC